MRLYPVFLWTPFLLALAGCASSATSPAASASAASVAAANGTANASHPQNWLAQAVAPSSQLSVTRGEETSAVAIAAPATPAEPLAAEPEQFAQELAAARKLPPQAVRAALAQARYNATVARLMAPPVRADAPRVRNWAGYRARFVEPIRIREGSRFWRSHAATLQAAEQRYGVPAAIIVAIIGVETVYGRNMGSFRVLDALYTLAFSYPSHARRDRSPYFREELAEFLAMTIGQGIDPTRLRGSYAGAMGIPQFMPSSIRRFAVSVTPGKAPDLINNPDDAIMSVANYLAAHGWQSGHPVFAPVKLPQNPASLVDGGLQPTLAWAQLANAGATPASRPAAAGLVSEAAVPTWTRGPLGVINLENASRPVEYRVATQNFFAITHYNRSYFYASAVADLAVELARIAGNSTSP